MLSDFEKFIIRCSSRYSRSYWLLPSVQQEWASLDNEMRQCLNFQISVKPAFVMTCGLGKEPIIWGSLLRSNTSNICAYNYGFYNSEQSNVTLKITPFFRSNLWCFNTLLRILYWYSVKCPTNCEYGIWYTQLFNRCSTLHYSEIKLTKFSSILAIVWNCQASSKSNRGPITKHVRKSDIWAYRHLSDS